MEGLNPIFTSSFKSLKIGNGIGASCREVKNKQNKTKT
jgi:hypothetical protein